MASQRDWARDRRARTRVLIEYGGLVVKAGLSELLEDDRATMLGGLLSLRDQLAGAGADEPAVVRLRWRRRGLRDFDAGARSTADGRSGPAGDGGSRAAGGDDREDPVARP